VENLEGKKIFGVEDKPFLEKLPWKIVVDISDAIHNVGDVKEIVLRDRQMLAQDGIFVVITVIDSQTGRVRNSPDIISRGFIYLRESQELLRQTRYLIRKTIEEATGKMHPINITYVKELVRDRIAKFLFQKTKRRPMVLPVLIEV
jgi:ribonuclease J